MRATRTRSVRPLALLLCAALVAAACGERRRQRRRRRHPTRRPRRAGGRRHDHHRRRAVPRVHQPDHAVRQLVVAVLGRRRARAAQAHGARRRRRLHPLPVLDGDPELERRGHRRRRRPLHRHLHDRRGRGVGRRRAHHLRRRRVHVAGHPRHHRHAHHRRLRQDRLGRHRATRRSRVVDVHRAARRLGRPVRQLLLAALLKADGLRQRPTSPTSSTPSSPSPAARSCSSPSSAEARPPSSATRPTGTRTARRCSTAATSCAQADTDTELNALLAGEVAAIYPQPAPGIADTLGSGDDRRVPVRRRHHLRGPVVQPGAACSTPDTPLERPGRPRGAAVRRRPRGDPRRGHHSRTSPRPSCSTAAAGSRRSASGATRPTSPTSPSTRRRSAVASSRAPAGPRATTASTPRTASACPSPGRPSPATPAVRPSRPSSSRQLAELGIEVTRRQQRRRHALPGAAPAAADRDGALRPGRQPGPERHHDLRLREHPVARPTTSPARTAPAGATRTPPTLMHESDRTPDADARLELTHQVGDAVRERRGVAALLPAAAHHGLATPPRSRAPSASSPTARSPASATSTTGPSPE